MPINLFYWRAPVPVPDPNRHLTAVTRVFIEILTLISHQPPQHLNLTLRDRPVHNHALDVIPVVLNRDIHPGFLVETDSVDLIRHIFAVFQDFERHFTQNPP